MSQKQILYYTSLVRQVYISHEKLIENLLLFGEPKAYLLLVCQCPNGYGLSSYGLSNHGVSPGYRHAGQALRQIRRPCGRPRSLQVRDYRRW